MHRRRNQRRFEALVKSALNTPPKPMKDRPKKRKESKARKAAKPSLRPFLSPSPKGAVLYDPFRIVVEFAEQRPTRLHEPFTALAMEALSTAWPCR
jgi:hypothetical protein